MARERTRRKRTVAILKHKDKRVNIPTEELRDFVAEEEKSPKPVLYPRDPSLDPQLVWTGKDDQDSKSLEVPAVPIYIQEKIHPQAIIEDLRQTVSGNNEPQMQLYADFNGLPEEFSKRVDFYHWDQNWSNRLILGDSLLVMTSLAEKEGLKTEIQMIYIDPPYGIRFGSNWQVSTRKRDVKDGKAEDVNREPEVVKAFRDTWQKGIHSYLAYLRDRLVVGRELMTESGSIFVQIGDENVHLVRALMDEVLGSDNFMSMIAFTKAAGGLESGERLSARLDYILWYAKNQSACKYRPLFEERGEPFEQGFDIVLQTDGHHRKLLPEERSGQQPLPEGASPCMSVLMTKPGPGAKYAVEFQGRQFDSGNRWWGMQQSSMANALRSGRVAVIGNSIRFLRKHSDFSGKAMSNLWGGLGGAASPVYVVQTNEEVVKRCLLMTTDPGDLVMDPTCGSGTTAFVAEQWGRRWVTTDTSRVALALARTRLMASRFPYYFVADTSEGVRKLAEVTGVIQDDTKTEGDLKKGFVYKRAPRITLKSIANNEEIEAIHNRWKERLNTVQSEFNRVVKQKWEEWQIPHEVAHDWPEKATALHTEWWKLRGERQQEIEASIAKHAETTLLYDQPYEDSSRIRVTGPFTVESLSPHRVIAAEQPASEADATHETSARFAPTMIENLRRAGVQNTVKNERLKFDRLEPYAGMFLNAAGEYTENGKSRRVAVSLGPEHGTVGPELIKEAAKEAVQGVGFDLLIVCGFAFDPHVYEEKKRYGKLTVLTPRINADLMMGDELLKKTAAGNLFMEFGEPDIEIKKHKDGKLIVEIKGVDVYDPTTGQIRNNSTDDIACWFIDTNYNGESFFVRHTYFTGADDPYEKLKKVLHAEVDDSAWASLYSTVSRPFPRPNANGKKPQIAVKVINHYGDEVMKVYSV